MQDFERAFHAELLLEADLEAKQREDVRKLPKWIRQYAYRAWQDRIYFDRNVTWFQQEVTMMAQHLCMLYYDRIYFDRNVTWFQVRVMVQYLGKVLLYLKGCFTVL